MYPRILLIGDVDNSIPKEKAASILKFTHKTEIVTASWDQEFLDSDIAFIADNVHPSKIDLILDKKISLAADFELLLKYFTETDRQVQDYRIFPIFFTGYFPPFLYLRKMIQSLAHLKVIYFYSEPTLEEKVFLRFLKPFFKGTAIKRSSEQIEGVKFSFRFPKEDLYLAYSIRKGYSLFRKKKGTLILVALPEGDGVIYQLMDICESVRQKRNALLYPPDKLLNAYREELEKHDEE